MATHETDDDGDDVYEQYQLSKRYDDNWKVTLGDGTDIYVRFDDRANRPDITVTDDSFSARTSMFFEQREAFGETVLYPTESVRDIRQSKRGGWGSRSDDGYTITAAMIDALRYLIRDEDIADGLWLKGHAAPLEPDWFMP